MTVNSVGAVFQLVYIILFISYAEKSKQVNISCNVLALVTLMDSRNPLMFLINFSFECCWQVTMLGLLLAVFGLFAIIVGGSLQIIDFSMRRMVVGLLSCASLISMFASPLFIIVSLFKAFPLYFCTDGTFFSFLIKLSKFQCLVLFTLTYINFFSQNLVIRTKSVEFMPFYLSLSTFLMSTSFLLYGIFNNDPFIYVSYLKRIKFQSFCL